MDALLRIYNLLLPMVLSKDEIAAIVDQTREEVYSIQSYKKFIGSILIQLKRDVVPLCNHEEIRYKYCKSAKMHRINPHQVCHGAAVYACQYYVKEGYDLESAKQLGCKMWNDVNKCRFFPIWKSRLNTDKWEDHDTNASVFDKNMGRLEKMCRQQHRECNLSVISDFTYKSGKNNRRITFWICFDNAIANLNTKELITKAQVLRCLKTWNEQNEVDLFVV